MPWDALMFGSAHTGAVLESLRTSRRLKLQVTVEAVRARGYPIDVATYLKMETGRYLPDDGRQFISAYAAALQLTSEEHRALAKQWALDQSLEVEGEGRPSTMELPAMGPQYSEGVAFDEYVVRAKEAVRAAGFEPRRCYIAGVYEMSGPFRDLLNGETLDPGGVVVLVVHRPPTEDTAGQELPIASATGAQRVRHALTMRFHQTTRCMLIGWPAGVPTIWLLGALPLGE